MYFCRTSYSLFASLEKFCNDGYRSNNSSQPILHTSDISNPTQGDYVPIGEMNIDQSASVNIPCNDASVYTCIYIWIRFDQITDVQNVLPNLVPAHSERWQDYFHSNSFVCSRSLNFITALPMSPILSTLPLCWEVTNKARNCKTMVGSK